VFSALSAQTGYNYRAMNVKIGILSWVRETHSDKRHVMQCIHIIMRPSSLGGGRILRCTLSVRLSVRLSVCPSVPLSLPGVTSRHLANYNDALRAAYRTAISAAQILVYLYYIQQTLAT